jgi:hypothetical protein
MWTPFCPAFFLLVRLLPNSIEDVPINFVYIYHGLRELRKKENLNRGLPL